MPTSAPEDPRVDEGPWEVRKAGREPGKSTSWKPREFKKVTRFSATDASVRRHS